MAVSDVWLIQALALGRIILITLEVGSSVYSLALILIWKKKIKRGRGKGNGNNIKQIPMDFVKQTTTMSERVCVCVCVCSISPCSTIIMFVKAMTISTPSRP